MRPTATRWRSYPIFALVASTLMMACGGETKPSTSCTYALTSSALSFDATGGTGSVGLQTAGTCSWSARADAGWISITGPASGTGPATVSFTVASNADTASRNGALTIAEKSVSIRQDGRQVNCTYAIAPESAAWTKDGGTGSFDLTTDDTCGWTADSAVAWITVTSPRQGNGSATITYTVPRNSDSTDRTGTIRAGGQVFSIRQSGDAGVCQYSVSPLTFSPCMPAVELSVDVVTQAGCPWTAAAGSPWITMTAGQSNSGSATARFQVTANYDAPRDGVVMLRWPTATAGQNLQISQAGCTYAVSKDSFSFAVSGGTGSFGVLQMSFPYTCGGPLQNGCRWSAQSNAPWITITSSMPKQGDESVSFSVSANGTGASRTGSITVQDKTVTITQAGS